MDGVDVRLGKVDGRETEWTQAQRKLGNLPEDEKEEKQDFSEKIEEDDGWVEVKTKNKNTKKTAQVNLHHLKKFDKDEEMKEK